MQRSLLRAWRVRASRRSLRRGEGIPFCPKEKFKVIRRRYFEWVYQPDRPFFLTVCFVDLQTKNNLIFDVFSSKLQGARATVPARKMINRPCCIHVVRVWVLLVVDVV